MITLSIVIHNQGALVSNLLNDIIKCRDKQIYLVILTFNTDEDDSFLEEFEDLNMVVIKNRKIKGFGANHNYAFTQCSTPYFIVCNPDIRLKDVRLKPLIDIASLDDVGVVAPACVDSAGHFEDSARKFPTVKSLLKRRFFSERHLDYDLADGNPITVDWVAGMFMCFRSENFRAVKGFDESFHLYFEDVDICYRLSQKDKRSMLLISETVQHTAQRTSHFKLRYFIWHVTSALRYFAKTRRDS